MATNQMRREAAKRKLANQQKHRAERARKRRQVATISSAAAVVVIIAAVILLTTRPWASDSATTAAAGDSAAPTAAATPAAIPTEVVPLPARPTPLPAQVSCDYPAAGSAAKPASPPPTSGVSARGTVDVALQTSAGAIPLTLDRALAPCAVNSFVSLAEQGYFDATSCHRLTTNAGLQVLQCGDPTGTGSGGPGYTFADETFPELTYGRGLLAMANAGPDTNGSQFFMIYGDAQLDKKYTVFGSVGEAGLATLDQVAKAGDDESNGSGDGAPIIPVTITSATVS